MQSKLVSSVILSTVSADLFADKCYEYGGRYWKGVLLPSKESGKYRDCGQEVCPAFCPKYSQGGVQFYGAAPEFYYYSFSRCGLSDRCIEAKTQKSFSASNRDIDEDWGKVDTPAASDTNNDNLDCATSDDGKTSICVDTEALKEELWSAGSDFLFGGGSDSSSSAPKKETPKPVESKNYADGTECPSNFDCASRCCKKNFILEDPILLDGYIEYWETPSLSEEKLYINKLRQEEIKSLWSTYEVAYPNPEHFPDVPRDNVPEMIMPTVK